MDQYGIYEVTLKHDKGTFKVRTNASSFNAAADIVRNVECAPLRSVKSVRLIRIIE